MDDFTQFPEENRAEILRYLLRFREDRHLSNFKMRAAITLYWELALGQPLWLLRDDNVQDGIRQEGPLCFLGLLRIWTDAVRESNSNQQRVLIEMWIKKLTIPVTFAGPAQRAEQAPVNTDGRNFRRHTRCRFDLKSVPRAGGCRITRRMQLDTRQKDGWITR